ncbi:MAG TPA: hypothetical protein VK184_12395 [Nostocaceae cyanobacterium]|nr:hypothetical protein [Nostocaceae cyanobacterium]
MLRLGEYAVLPKITNSCLVYYNPTTITQVVLKRVPRDDEEIQIVYGEILKTIDEGKCSYIRARNTNTYDINDWNCEVPGYGEKLGALFDRYNSLERGYDTTEEISVPNPAYDPNWLSATKRIITLNSSQQNSRFIYTDRNILEKNPEEEIISVTTFPNFISMVEFSFTDQWYATVEYTCDDFIDLNPSDGRSGGGGGGGTTITRCGKCELSLKNCCLDLHLLEVIVKQKIGKK